MRNTNWRSTLTMAALISAMGASPAFAEDLIKPVVDVLSNNGEGYDLSDSILGEDSPYNFGGWLAVGYESNRDGLFNNHQGVNVTQAWLFAQKSLNAAEGFDWGFRADIMSGVDAADTQAFGNSPNRWDFDSDLNWGKYGFAAPQLYVELGYKDFSIKGGHFFTPVGYEVVTAPDNFFYSHSFTMYLSEPFTHTGFLATYSGIDKVSLFGGWTAGWDTGFDQLGNGSNFLGGASVKPTDWSSITYTLTAGNMGAIGSGYSHSIVLTADLTEKLNYVFQSDYVDVDNQGSNYETVGVNQHLFYAVSDKIKVGTRAEWWRSDGTDYYAVTAGVNFQVLPNLKLRPEFRYQFSPEVDNDPTQNTAGLPMDQAAVAFDAIITF